MIINSLLDTDFYKLTMMQAVLHQYPGAWVKYRFKCRGRDLVFSGYGFNRLKDEIRGLCSLKFQKDELEYLSGISFFKRDFIEYLRNFRFNEEYIDVGNDVHGELDIVIEGSWLSTILFEVPVLAIVSETFYGEEDLSVNIIEEGRKILGTKIKLVTDLDQDSFKFADFGTRRRFSYWWHEGLIEAIYPLHSFIGTSNVHFAMKYGLQPIGTMAHEWVCAHQQLGHCRVADSQKAALDAWAKEYRGELGIALSDTVGFKAFLNDFDLYFAKLFDGCRHDSGAPYDWCYHLLHHYRKFGIDARTKTAVFSDGLDMKSAIDLHRAFHKYINTSFGIGTNLTNDLGVEPLQIVIKMVECNGQPVAKISDSPGKGMCENPGFESYIRDVFGLEKQ